ncbi:transcriptional regulator, partial [Klebsiella pneumoniae]
MQKRLNTDKAQQAIDKAGLTQTAVADALGVTKEAVSQWLLHKSFPRPNKLLQLGKLLNLSFDDLVIKEDPHAPKVAFRKMRGTKTKDYHIEKAQEIGRFLRHLVPYLPFDTFEMPPVLKSPSCDYDYLRTVTAKVREDINLGPVECVDFTHLIRRFSELQAVVV